LHQLRFWLSELNVDTRVVRSSELPISSSKSDLVLDLCRHFGAQRYLSGEQGRGYLVESHFDEAGIAIEYQSFKAPVYFQLWGDFIPNLGILDWWMNMDGSPLGATGTNAGESVQPQSAPQ